MADRIRTGLVYLIAMAMVTAVAAAPTVAQVFDPEAERVYEVTANADTVDGFSAIGATANKALRARKLVATNRYGQLPSNIIRPRWRELKGVPAGFKDGVDNQGVWKLTISHVENAATVGAGDTQYLDAYCPTGTRVIGGGFSQSDFDVRVTDSDSYDESWYAFFVNDSLEDRGVYVSAVCLGTSPSSGLASKGSIGPAGKKR